MEEQTGGGADVGGGLDVRFGLQPVEKDLDRLPDAADVRGRGVLGDQNIVLFPLSWRDEPDIPLGLQVRFPIRVNIGAVRVKPPVRDRRAVQVDLLRRPQVTKTGFADLHGTGNGQPVRTQLGENVQLDAVIPEVFRRIPRQIAERLRGFRGI